MDWILGSGVYWAAFTGSYPPSTSPAWFPSELDLSLITIAYKVAAADATCARCGTPLARRTPHLTPQYCARPSAWRVLVTTRCRGWRHHRHTALVTETAGNLHLGPLQPGRSG
jgi:hypothetical protein